MAIDPSKALAGIPSSLRDPLLEEYRGLSDAYAQGRWKLASLDAARFCEIVYTILDGTLTGMYPATLPKIQNFPGLCIALEHRQPHVGVGDRSMRFLIPKALLGIYEVRNNRNVGHVRSDVVANHMDATLVHATASWVLAELIRIFHNVTTTEAQQTVDALVERKVPLIWEIGSTRRVLVPNMPAADKALVLLYGQAGWTSTRTLSDWAKYSNHSVFRSKVLAPLSDALLIELDSAKDVSVITPLGTREVENRIFHSPTAGALA